MKYFIPNPKLTRISAKSIADDLNEYIEDAELDINPIKAKDITDKVGQEYTDKFTKLVEDMVDNDEEDLVDGRMELAGKILKKYFK